VPKDIYDFYEKMDRDEDDETELQTVSFQINQDTLEKLQKRFVTNVNCILSYFWLTQLERVVQWCTNFLSLGPENSKPSGATQL